jgi:tetratricopeptide (TPR) repeat protein
MPRRDVAIISHSALTNHRIPATPNATAPIQEQADPGTGLILVDRPAGRDAAVPDITLLRAYGELADRDAGYRQRYLELLGRMSGTDAKEPFVQAALGHKALAEGKSEEALAHLIAAAPLDDSTVYRDTAQAMINLGRVSEAVNYLQRAENVDPFNPVVQKSLILQYINLKRYPDARQAMEAYVKEFPSDTFMRNLLTRVSN